MSTINASEYWRQLPFSVEPAALQLAAADALMTGLGESPPRPAVRWYAVAAPALVIGTGQSSHEIDMLACGAAGITMHRRASGGTAVLLESDALLLDIAVPTGHRLYCHDVTESYNWLGDVWVATLQTLGLSAQAIAIPAARADTQSLDPLTRRACFGGRSPYEVLVDNRKIVGFSQVRRRNGAILQVGLYIHWNPRRIADLLAITPDKRSLLTERLLARVAGLGDLLAVPPDLATVMQAFATALRNTQRVTLEDADWSDLERETRSQAAVRYAPL